MNENVLSNMPEQTYPRLHPELAFHGVKAAIGYKRNFLAKLADVPEGSEDHETYSGLIANTEAVVEKHQSELHQIYDAAEKSTVSGFTFVEVEGVYLLEEGGKIVVVNAAELVQKAMDHATAFVSEEEA